MPRTILDVSRWQGSIDWDKVKRSGLVSGVMIRAMGNSKEGKPSKPYSASFFARNYAECQRLGIPVGVYGYFKATTKAQADRELALFKQALGGRAFQLPVAVDIEDTLQAALSKSALTDIVAHCLSVVESWGVYAMLYTGLNFGQTNFTWVARPSSPTTYGWRPIAPRSPPLTGPLGCGSTPAAERSPASPRAQT